MVRVYTSLFVCVFLLGCKLGTEEGYTWKELKVTATAYNSLAYQTSANPHITAWGDSLVPGKKYIAVSRDLIKLGLTHDTPVLIEGFDGIYWVKDKMHSRWRKRIDIYMDMDVKKAKEWGRRKVNIKYGVRLPDSRKPKIEAVTANGK